MSEWTAREIFLKFIKTKLVLQVRLWLHQFAIVDEMKCKCHKESWAAGASEVNIITVVSDFGFFEYDINLYGKGDNGGGKIYKVQCQSTVRIRSVDTYYKIGYIPVFGANYWTSSTGFHFTSQY